MKVSNYEKVFNEDLYNKRMAALVMLMSNLAGQDEWESAHAKPAALAEVETRIVENFMNLPTLDREKIEADRDTVINIEREIQLYKMSLSRSMFIALKRDNADYAKSHAEEIMAGTNVDTEKIIDLCLDYVAELDKDDEVGRARRMSEILAMLPIRITKEKFLDYMRDTLGWEPFKQVCEAKPHLLETYRLNMNPNTDPNFGKDFSEIAARANEIYAAAKADEWDENSFGALGETADEFEDECSEIEEYLDIVYENLNFLLIIEAANENAGDFLENELLLKDLFYSTRARLKRDGAGDEADDELDLRLDKLLEDETENRTTAAAEAGKKATAALKDILRKNKIPDEDYLNEWRDAVQFYFADLSKDASLYADTQCTEEECIGTMRESLSAEPPKISRLLRGYFLSKSLCHFSFGEFHNYLHENLPDDMDAMAKALAVFEIISHQNPDAPALD